MPLKPPKKKSGIKLYVLIFFLFPFFISMDDIYIYIHTYIYIGLYIYIYIYIYRIIYISWCWKKMAFVTKQNSKS